MLEMIHYTMGLESNGCSTLRDERQTQAPYQSIPFTPSLAQWAPWARHLGRATRRGHEGAAWARCPPQARPVEDGPR